MDTTPLPNEAEQSTKVYKTPIYVRNAKRNYHNRRVAVDPEYAQRVREQQRAWHAKQRLEDEEYREKHRQRNIDHSAKRTEQYIHSFIDGDELKTHVETFHNHMNLSIAADDLHSLVKSVIMTQIDGSPLYVHLRKDHPKRRIKNICIAAIYFVSLKLDKKIKYADIVSCYGVSYPTISEIVGDIKRYMLH